MKKKLSIDVSALPDEGKTYSGELDTSVLQLREKDTEAVGALEYDIHVQKFDNELLIRGTLSMPIRFTCVRTLEQFVQTIQVDEFDTCLEITGSELDLTGTLCEELMLQFPDYPRCDEADDPMECNIDSRYLAVDKPVDDDVKTPPRDAAPNPWDALDAIQDDTSSNPR